MEFFVQQAVLDAGVKILFPVIRGMDNTVESDEWKAYRTKKLHELYAQYEALDVHADPVLEGFNTLHDETGVKRRKNIPASENLIKLLKKNQGEMFYINTAVDVYNLLSLESKLALGAHNIDTVDGNVTLRFTDGTERFVPLGQTEPIPVAPHVYCYCDDSNEVLCRLEIRPRTCSTSCRATRRRPTSCCGTPPASSLRRRRNTAAAAARSLYRRSYKRQKRGLSAPFLPLKVTENNGVLTKEPFCTIILIYPARVRLRRRRKKGGTHREIDEISVRRTGAGSGAEPDGLRRRQQEI